MSTYRRYDDGSSVDRPLVNRALRRLSRGAHSRNGRPIGARGLFLVETTAERRDQGHDVPSRRLPVLIRPCGAPGATTRRSGPRRTRWKLRFRHGSPGLPNPGERYKIDPQFVPRALERVP